MVITSKPPSGRGLIGNAIAFFEEDCGWVTGRVIRKIHGSGIANYAINFSNDDDADVRDLEVSLFHGGHSAPKDQHGAWCVIEKKKT